MYCDYNTPVSCQEPIDLSKKTELPAAFKVEDPNAGSQSGRVVSDPIKKQKPRKKGRTPKVYVDSETLKYNQRNQSIEQYLYTDGPYSQPGALVPYQNPIAPRKKRKWKAEVDLESESLSMWNLLTNTDEGKGKEEVGREKYTWWERERTLFRGRRDSFTARMHTFLGMFSLY
ncbi:hypothetical protein CFOL_v3_05323 [Cephalotus follicularis]|uniref:Uncharacterized protein n=1 Tax=Cephalotus follicularis TaxID=3775 RepID=A0A1Q3B1B2_CEPFO|nr:hypothetical protein CFOL_v3_05323 [Cephalotus follicularis]